MRNFSSLLKIAALITVIVASGGGIPLQSSAQPGQESRIEAALQQARRIADELAETVRGLLFKELEKGGYASAVRVCSEVAQDIPREFTARTGHYVRRVSLGYRNPKDIPDDYERQKLEEFDRLNREKKLANEYFEVVREGQRDYLRYMRPLIAGPMCITCHGEKANIPPEVKAILAEKYPDDRATGYHTGDVRGAISVKIALPTDKR
ncbi:MAG TPA: DUF3365 domain-containing protein [Blastocatellia bacterium]|nr:DUF3365 domain-containing protein [Blastocatellia bacterium]